MARCSYVNLHQHSHWSILDAISNYSDYCDIIEETPDQIKAFAMTEHGFLGGTIDYLNTCKERGFKPLVGMESYVCTEASWQDWEQNKKPPQRHHLIILAKNKQGYRDLVAMNNWCIKNKRVYTSRIGRWYVLQTPEILEKFNKGNWFVTAACVGSYVFGPYNFDGDVKEAVRRYEEMKSIFGEDFFFEFQFLDIPSQRRMNELQMKLMQRFPEQRAIVSCDAHYHKKGMGELRELTMSMNWKVTLKQFKKITSEKDSDQEEQVNIHFRTNDELYDEWQQYYSDIIPEDVFQKACETTIDIYEAIKPFKLDKTQDLETLRKYFDGDADEIIKKRCIEGLKTKVGSRENLDEYKKQLKLEMKIVEEKKIGPYFLALMTVLDNLKKNDQYIGIGRGSGGSFLINYLLGITNVDPIEHGLMSERFLDMAREDYPDIDIDVEDRDTMFRIFKKTFPSHDVVLLSNRNTLSVKALMKAVWRVLDIDIPIKGDALDSADKISKYLDDNYNALTLDLEGFLGDKFIQEIIGIWQERQTGIDLELVLKELYQNLSAISVHAGGLVIIDPKENIIPYVPLLGNTMSHYATAFCESASYKELEQIGHIKFDMLGLGNLRCLHNTVENVAKDFGITEESVRSKIDPNNLDLKIPRVYAGFQKGFTEGIFQFSSAGMTSILQRMKADSIGDLTVANALYRPGPLGSKIHELVIQNKFDEDAEKIFSDKMWNKIGFILDNTYGVFCVSEDTLVTTEEGDVPIKDICVGTILPSFNEETGELEKDIVTNVVNSGEKETIIIKTENSSITLTKDHLVFTNRGWIKAGKLTLDDKILSLVC